MQWVPCNDIFFLPISKSFKAHGLNDTRKSAWYNNKMKSLLNDNKLN